MRSVVNGRSVVEAVRLVAALPLAAFPLGLALGLTSTRRKDFRVWGRLKAGG